MENQREIGGKRVGNQWKIRGKRVKNEYEESGNWKISGKFFIAGDGEIQSFG